MARLKFRAGQGDDAIKFCVDRFEPRGSEIASGASNIRNPAVFHDQTAGREQGSDFGIAKFMQQCPNVAVDGLGPDVLACIEIAAYENSIDSCIRGGGIERN